MLELADGILEGGQVAPLGHGGGVEPLAGPDEQQTAIAAPSVRASIWAARAVRAGPNASSAGRSTSTQRTRPSAPSRTRSAGPARRWGRWPTPPRPRPRPASPRPGRPSGAHEARHGLRPRDHEAVRVEDLDRGPARKPQAVRADAGGIQPDAAADEPGHAPGVVPERDREGDERRRVHRPEKRRARPSRDRSRRARRTWSRSRKSIGGPV